MAENRKPDIDRTQILKVIKVLGRDHIRREQRFRGWGLGSSGEGLGIGVEGSGPRVDALSDEGSAGSRAGDGDQRGVSE